MFPTIIKKKKNRGSSVFLENPEPSSPKVSCIGQVKVKTKKQGKKMKMLACRYGTATDKKVIQHSNSNNQRWVHLPLTICKSFKCFGCNFSCFSNNDDACCGSCSCSCGGGCCSGCCGVLRWLVCLPERNNETDDSLSKNRRKEVELVVSGVVVDNDENSVMERVCSRRRSIFDDVEFDDLFNNVGISSNDNVNVNDDGNDVERGRVSICEPPKNALLLMRCKSNPMKMASLSQKFWDPKCIIEQDNDVDCVVNEEVSVIKEDNCVEVEGLSVNEDEIIEIKDEIIEESKVENVKLVDEICEDLEIVCSNDNVLLVSSEEFEQKFDDEKQGIENREKTGEKQSSVEEQVLRNVEETQLREGLVTADGCSIEMITVGETVEKGENVLDLVERLENQVMEVEEGSEGEESSVTQYHPITLRQFQSEESTVESKELEPKQEKVGEEESVAGQSRISMEKERNKSMLPDCLLLMMCEPKLSMEVSKETWVCRTDFIRRLPSRHGSKKTHKTESRDDPSSNNNSNSNSNSNSHCIGNGNGNKRTKAAAVAAQPPLPPLGQGGRSSIQPGRSSISFPTGSGSMANLIEQKLANAGLGFEPFVLTRCKSAPLRTTAKFVSPELA